MGKLQDVFSQIQPAPAPATPASAETTATTPEPAAPPPPPNPLLGSYTPRPNDRYIVTVTRHRSRTRDHSHRHDTFKTQRGYYDITTIDTIPGIPGSPSLPAALPQSTNVYYDGSSSPKSHYGKRLLYIVHKAEKLNNEWRIIHTHMRTKQEKAALAAAIAAGKDPHEITDHIAHDIAQAPDDYSHLDPHDYERHQQQKFIERQQARRRTIELKNKIAEQNQSPDMFPVYIHTRKYPMPFQARAAGRPAAEITLSNLLDRHNDACPDSQKTIISNPKEKPRYIVLVRNNYDHDLFQKYIHEAAASQQIKKTASIYIVDTLSGETAADWIKNSINPPVTCSDESSWNPKSKYARSLAHCEYIVKRLNYEKEGDA
jgi:hypothetical protein